MTEMRPTLRAINRPIDFLRLTTTMSLGYLGETMSIFMRLGPLTIVSAVLTSFPAFAQLDVKAAIVKHLKTSRDFTLKVAEQMPDVDYGFKLTPPQMSFAEQITHLAQEQAEFLAPFSSGKPNAGKP